MWNGIGWYGFIGPTTSTTDISLHINIIVVLTKHYHAYAACVLALASLVRTSGTVFKEKVYARRTHDGWTHDGRRPITIAHLSRIGLIQIRVCGCISVTCIMVPFTF